MMAQKNNKNKTTIVHHLPKKIDWFWASVEVHIKNSEWVESNERRCIREGIIKIGYKIKYISGMIELCMFMLVSRLRVSIEFVTVDLEGVADVAVVQCDWFILISIVIVMSCCWSWQAARLIRFIRFSYLLAIPKRKSDEAKLYTT